MHSKYTCVQYPYYEPNILFFRSNFTSVLELEYELVEKRVRRYNQALATSASTRVGIPHIPSPKPFSSFVMQNSSALLIRCS